ncbi:hypothetical protein GTY80_08190 [Amycolatopsis sp. SID8362]|nr:hypothetical protein [Amycolatopsis sp. SID8362]
MEVTVVEVGLVGFGVPVVGCSVGGRVTVLVVRLLPDRFGLFRFRCALLGQVVVGA